MFGASFPRNLLSAVCAVALALGLAFVPAVVTEGAHGPQAKGDGWAVLAPVSYQNLTIFPVRGRDLVAAGDYITLDEGLRRGTVIVGEKGSTAVAGRPLRERPPAPA